MPWEFYFWTAYAAIWVWLGVLYVRRYLHPKPEPVPVSLVKDDERSTPED